MTISSSAAGSVTWADRRGADRGIGFTTSSLSKKKRPGCRTIQRDGLEENVLRCRRGSQIAAGYGHRLGSIVL